MKLSRPQRRSSINFRILFIFAILVVAGGFFFFKSNNSNVLSSSSTVPATKVYFSPSSATGSVGVDINTDLMIDTGGNEVKSGTIYISYDTAYFTTSVLSYGSLPAPAVVSGPVISGTTGTLKVVLGIPSGSPFNGVGRIVSFKVKPKVTFSLGKQISVVPTSIVSATGMTGNALISGGKLTVYIGPTTATPTPSVCGKLCTTNAQCGTGKICYTGKCRNSSCPTQTSCSCPTPTPTVTGCANINTFLVRYPCSATKNSFSSMQVTCVGKAPSAYPVPACRSIETWVGIAKSMCGCTVTPTPTPYPTKTPTPYPSGPPSPTPNLTRTPTPTNLPTPQAVQF